MKKIRLIGARKYIQGFPPYQPKVEKYKIEFEGDDAIIPLEKYEEDVQLKEVFSHFPSYIFEED